jgi:hypothetical protein
MDQRIITGQEAPSRVRAKLLIPVPRARVFRPDWTDHLLVSAYLDVT